MDPVTRGTFRAGRGIVGYAYQGGRRQVTLIGRQDWDLVIDDLGDYVDPAARRANLLVSGLSLADIANRLGVSKPTVWAWEHGKSRPVEKRLSALAEALGVTPGGLEPAPSGPSEELERSRRRIAQAYGVEPARVRIMIEL